LTSSQYACVCMPGTMPRSTRYPGTSPGIEVDLCGIGTVTIPTVTPDQRWDSRRRRRSRPAYGNAFWTQRMPHAVRCPVYFAWQTRHESWRSCRSVSGLVSERRRNRLVSPCRNHNHLSPRLEQQVSDSISIKIFRAKMGQDRKFQFSRAFVSLWKLILWRRLRRKSNLF